MQESITYSVMKDFGLEEVLEAWIDVPVGMGMQDNKNSVSVYLDASVRTQSIEVYKNTGFRFGDSKTLPAQVNWFACGAQPASVAEWFGEVLIFASVIAEEINHMKKQVGEL